MKKLLSVFIAVLIVCSLCAPVMADVIVAPKIIRDEFLESHSAECEKIGHRYEAQAETEIRVSPEDETLLGTVIKGDSVLIAYGWNGWGLVETVDGYAGWISMRDMRRLFDGTIFTEKYGGEIKQVDGELYLEIGRRVPMYTFPGSGDVIDEMSATSENDTVASYSELWTDAQGRDWGYVGYYFTHSGWVCISDPYSELSRIWPEYADEESGPVPVKSDTETTRSSMLALVIALVAAAVGSTVTALVVMTRKNRKTAE